MRNVPAAWGGFDATDFRQATAHFKFAGDLVVTAAHPDDDRGEAFDTF